MVSVEPASDLYKEIMDKGHKLISDRKYDEALEFVNQLLSEWELPTGRLLRQFELPETNGTLITPDTLRVSANKKLTSTLREGVIEKKKENLDKILERLDSKYHTTLGLELRRVLNYVAHHVEEVEDLKKFRDEIKKGKISRMLKEKEFIQRGKWVAKALSKIERIELDGVNAEVDAFIGKFSSMKPSPKIVISPAETEEDHKKYTVQMLNKSVYPWFNPSLRILFELERYDEGEMQTQSFKPEVGISKKGVRTIPGGLDYTNIVRDMDLDEYELKCNIYVPIVGPTKIKNIDIVGECEHAFIKDRISTPTHTIYT